jgi:hypothetical protein
MLFKAIHQMEAGVSTVREKVSKARQIFENAINIGCDEHFTSF